MNQSLEKVKQAEALAQAKHLEQPYGDHTEPGDYYRHHLDPVRHKALELYDDTGTNKHDIEVTALLHDIIEDTDISHDDINNQFGIGIANAVQRLSYDKSVSKKEYLSSINSDQIARIVKAADRLVNVSKLDEVTDLQQREKLLDKYEADLKYFQEFDIYPEQVEAALKDIRRKIG